MKTNRITTRWLGLALACSTIALAASAQAKKPVPPPPDPEPDPGPPYRIFAVEAPINPHYYAVGDRGITDSGALVGSARFDLPEEGRSFQSPAVAMPRLIDGELRYLTGDLHWLPDVDGTQEYGECLAMNAGGIAVGAVSSHLPGWQAMLWLADGTPINLAVSLDLQSDAEDINDAGVVVVGVGEENQAGEVLGVVVPLDANTDGIPDTWFTDADGNGINDLFMPIGFEDNLFASMLNESGQLLLGGQSPSRYLLTPDVNDADGDGNPWYADVDADGFNDLLVELGPFVPGASVDVEGLNNAGQVVGRSGGHVLRWDFVDGVQFVTDLGALSDKLNMVPVGISDSGRIAGRSWTQTGRRTKDGPGWLIEDDTIHELLPLLVNPGGWSELEPRGINRHGWIQGVGVLDGTWGHTFVAIPVGQP